MDAYLLTVSLTYWAVASGLTLSCLFYMPVFEAARERENVIRSDRVCSCEDDGLDLFRYFERI